MHCLTLLSSDVGPKYPLEMFLVPREKTLTHLSLGNYALDGLMRVEQLVALLHPDFVPAKDLVQLSLTRNLFSSQSNETAAIFLNAFVQMFPALKVLTMPHFFANLTRLEWPHVRPFTLFVCESDWLVASKWTGRVRKLHVKDCQTCADHSYMDFDLLGIFDD